MAAIYSIAYLRDSRRPRRCNTYYTSVRSSEKRILLNSRVAGGGRRCANRVLRSISIGRRERERPVSVNWVDFAIVATLIWFTYAAFHAGLIREVITIVGAIFAVALAGLFYQDLTPDVKVAVNDEETARVIAFAIIFFCVVLASQLTAMFLKTTASVFMLGMFDSLGGALVGALKAFVFIEIALIVGITFANLHVQRAIDDSAFAGFFLNALPVLKHILPAQFKEAIDSF